MTRENTVARLAAEIMRVLDEGFDLGSEAWHFIQSTFPDKSAAELAELMAAGEDLEAGPLMELLFFPDEDLQVRLEGLLSSLALQPREQGVLVALLADYGPVARITCAGWGAEAVRFAMPAEALPLFVERLKIGHRLAPPVAEAITRRVAAADGDRLRVKLRNARIPFSPAQVAFICELLPRLPRGDRDLLEIADFVLALMDELHPDGDIQEGLLAKKKFYFQNLQRARQMAAMIHGRNMETLMLQGVRMPYVDQNDALRKMHLIDRICIALLGRSVYFQRVCGSSQDAVFVDGSDIALLNRLLL